MAIEPIPSLESLLGDLRAAADLAWERRSPAEKSAREAEQSEGVAPSVPADADALRDAQSRAALSGWIKPLNLLAGLAVSDPVTLLDGIATAFDRARTPEGWQWLMRANARANVFRSLAREIGTSGRSVLRQALVDARVVPTDAAGDRLRMLLAGDPAEQIDPAAIVPGMMPESRPSAAADGTPDLQGAYESALQALGWAKLAAEQNVVEPAPVEAAQGAVRRGLAEQIRLADCERLMTAGVYGYDEHRARLKAFAAQPAVPGLLVATLPIEGIGGAGKSTLLAELVSSLVADDTIITIQLDFDRLSFRNGGESELSLEVARQIGLAVPAVDQPLRALIAQVKAERAPGADKGDAPQEQALLSSDHFMFQAAYILRAEQVDARPVLLVLDTFEEWRRQSPDELRTAPPSDRLSRVVEWISQLKDWMGLSGLRVVIGGRVTLDSFAGALAVQPRIELMGIDREDARGLLTRVLKLDRPGPEIEPLLALTETSGHRWMPLTLHIAAKLYGRLSAEDRERFLTAREWLGAMDEGLRQGLLYARYLDHVGDDNVRALAMPGLLLRRVTVPIIQHVLAGPCKLGEVDLQRAKTLFDALENETWLVQRIGDALVHRGDVRSVMVRMMAEDPKRRDDVAALHQAALGWYRTGGGLAELPSNAARQEALYHYLTLLPAGAELPDATGNWFTEDDIKALASAADDYPRPLAAQLRCADGGQLDDADLGYLSAAARAKYLLARGAYLVGEGENDAAVELYRRIGGDEPLWLAQAEVNAVRWRSRLAPLAGTRSVSAEDWAAGRGSYRILRAYLSNAALELARLAREFEDTAVDWSKAQPVPADVLVDTTYMLLVALGREGVRRLAPEIGRLIVRGVRQSPSRTRSFEGWACARVVAHALDLDEETTQSLCEASPSVILAGLMRPDPRLVGRARDALQELDLPAAREALQRYADRLATPASITDLISTWPAELSRDVSLQPEEATLMSLRLPVSVLVPLGQPEARPATRAAITMAFPGDAALDRLLTILDGIVPIKPLDFGAQGRVDQLRRSRQMLIRAVDLLDRAGAMPRAIDELQTAAPNDPWLAAASDIKRWYHAAHALSNVSSSLPEPPDEITPALS